MEQVLGFIRDNRERHLAELIDLLRIQSISADSTKNSETRRAAEFIEGVMKRIGIDNVRLIETGGHPVVYGDWLHAPGKPTVLIYGHYDVQPVDPISEWESLPFEPSVREGKLYGRGTSDDKAQVMTHLYALEALMKVNGSLPCNVKFFIEGEEESGSAHTAPFVVGNREMLACDAVAISDTAWYSRDVPTIVYALRGLSYMEFKVKGPVRDLHSGSYGGMVMNPLNAVARIISKLQDEDGRILVPGFYDDVVPITDEERREFAAVGDPDAEIMADICIPAMWGEKGYTTMERNWGRPSLDVNGIYGGFQGEGGKTVIPAYGGFKMSTRLVPNQRPEKVFRLVEKYIQSICPPGVVVEAKYHHGGEPVMVPIDNFFIEAARGAFEEVFGKRPALVREGASIPITATFVQELKAAPVLIGYGLPDDHIHSPNEKMDLENFYKGIETNAVMFVRFGSR